MSERAEHKMSSKEKKPGLFKRLFSSNSKESYEKEVYVQKYDRHHSAPADSVSTKKTEESSKKTKELNRTKNDKPTSSQSGAAKQGQKSSATGSASQSSSSKQGQKKSSSSATSRQAITPSDKRRKRRDKKTVNLDVDTSKALEYPCTPEMILAYHKHKPFLNSTEEWLVVELNEFECLIESLDILRLIAKSSKFFEVEPAELWEEFFEFVEDIPSYDDVINNDIWQEFRDKRYPY